MIHKTKAFHSNSSDPIQKMVLVLPSFSVMCMNVLMPSVKCSGLRK